MQLVSIRLATFLVPMGCSLLPWGAVQAQSFDCAKAATEAEHAVCNDKTLGGLDVKLSNLLKTAVTKAPNRRAALIRDEQSWISDRDTRCTTANALNDSLSLAQCVAEMYRSRIAQLMLATELRLDPACSDAERVLDDWLNQGGERNPIFPSALMNSQPADKLPGRSEADFDVFGIVISDVRAGRAAMKAVTYGEGGTCHGGRFQLWDQTFRHEIPIPTGGMDESSNAPLDLGDADDYASVEVALLEGKPYFAHLTRSAKYVKLYELKSDLTAAPACEIVREPSETGSIRFAADADLCATVLAAKADYSILATIEPTPLPDDVSARVFGGLAWGQDGPISVIARGSADPFNDGQSHPVEMIEYRHSDGAGCGHDWRKQWPVILDQGGSPIPVPLDQDAAFGQAGQASRLLRYHGTTYFETRTPDPLDGVPLHEVWKLGAGAAATKMCSFRHEHYRARYSP
ncbi:MAG TPA: lysozyme inhibitor LprI family protein [Burkholderiaceae bacterium]|nr:lysozyme inhibitor LprI family protein [Burkholderiaceae bacterium]